jgi:uncharacterized protein
MIFEEPVMFHSSGVPLVGHFFRSSERARPRQPLVVCMGSWLTVKEQMASTYARRLAELGYAAFVFDFSGFGQSGGEPRQAELPARKIQDLFAAVEFASTLSFVDPERIACLGICASAQYTLAALARGLRVRSFASVAGWYHDPDSIAPFYGGAEGVALRLSRARAALQKQLAGEHVLAPAYAEGTTAPVCTSGSTITRAPSAAPCRNGGTRWQSSRGFTGCSLMGSTPGPTSTPRRCSCTPTAAPFPTT